MRKSLIWRAVAACGVLWLLHAQGFAPAAGAAEPGGKTYQWKIATLAPKGIGPSKAAEELIYPGLEAACNGAIKVKVYWGGVMGDDRDCLKKIRIGQLQGAALSSEGTIMACPEFSVVELPFLFNNYEEVDYVRSKMFPMFVSLFKQYGYKLGSWIDQDFDPIYSLTSPITRLEDFKKFRFGTAHGKMEEMILRNLGSDTVPLSVPEAPSAIRQGVVSAGIAPTFFLIGAQLYTSAKYVTPINIRYSPAVTVLSWKTWMDVPEECRARLDAENERGTRLLCDMIQDMNRKFLKALTQYGVKKVEVSPEAYRELKKKSQAIYGEMAGTIFPARLLDEVQGYLKEYRAMKEIRTVPAVPQPDQDLDTYPLPLAARKLLTGYQAAAKALPAAPKK